MHNDTSAETMAQIYRFLAQSMRYPDSHWLNNNYWQLLQIILEKIQWSDKLAELIRARDASLNFLEDLQVEHTRLFINAVPHVVAPPYASVYFKGDGTLYGNIAEKTKAFYREKGFDLKQEDDLPDHIVYELEFLALLVKEDPESEKLFLDTLFTPWFTIFCSL